MGAVPCQTAGCGSTELTEHTRTHECTFVTLYFYTRTIIASILLIMTFL